MKEDFFKSYPISFLLRVMRAQGHRVILNWDVELSVLCVGVMYCELLEVRFVYGLYRIFLISPFSCFFV